MKRVTVWGTTLKKVADEAQMISHYEIIKTFAPNAQVTMLTYSRPLVEQSYGGLIVTAIPQLHKSLPRIFKSDLFVIGGGPFFDHLPHLLRVAALLFVLWLARVPVLIYGVTGFPVKSWLENQSSGGWGITQRKSSRVTPVHTDYYRRLVSKPPCSKALTCGPYSLPRRTFACRRYCDWKALTRISRWSG